MSRIVLLILLTYGLCQAIDFRYSGVDNFDEAKRILHHYESYKTEAISEDLLEVEISNQFAVRRFAFNFFNQKYCPNNQTLCRKFQLINKNKLIWTAYEYTINGYIITLFNRMGQSFAHIMPPKAYDINRINLENITIEVTNLLRVKEAVFYNDAVCFAKYYFGDTPFIEMNYQYPDPIITDLINQNPFVLIHGNSILVSINSYFRFYGDSSLMHLNESLETSFQMEVWYDLVPKGLYSDDKWDIINIPTVQSAGKVISNYALGNMTDNFVKRYTDIIKPGYRAPNIRKHIIGVEDMENGNRMIASFQYKTIDWLVVEDDLNCYIQFEQNVNAIDLKDIPKSISLIFSYLNMPEALNLKGMTCHVKLSSDFKIGIFEFAYDQVNEISNPHKLTVLITPKLIKLRMPKIGGLYWLNQDHSQLNSIRFSLYQKHYTAITVGFVLVGLLLTGVLGSLLKRRKLDT